LPAQADTAPSIFGFWREAEMQALVRVYPCAGKLCGDLVDLPEDAPQSDTRNPDPADRGRPLIGITLIEGFRPLDKNGHIWIGGGEQGRLPGRIYVPSNGDTLGDADNTYVIRLTDRNSLSIGIYDCFLTCLGKSTWQRVPAPPGAP
jgi:hypothetical protein